MRSLVGVVKFTAIVLYISCIAIFILMAPKKRKRRETTSFMRTHTADGVLLDSQGGYRDWLSGEAGEEMLEWAAKRGREIRARAGAAALPAPSTEPQPVESPEPNAAPSPRRQHQPLRQPRSPPSPPPSAAPNPAPHPPPAPPWRCVNLACRTDVQARFSKRGWRVGPICEDCYNLYAEGEGARTRCYTLEGAVKWYKGN